MSPARRHLLFAVVLLATCGSAPIAEGVRTPSPVAAVAPTTTIPPHRLPRSEAAALAHLASVSTPIVTALSHEHEPATLVSSLPPDEQAQFDLQIRAAVDAASAFADTDTTRAQDMCSRRRSCLASARIGSSGRWWMHRSIPRFQRCCCSINRRCTPRVSPGSRIGYAARNRPRALPGPTTSGTAIQACVSRTAS